MESGGATPIPLRDYVAEDKKSSGKVPDEPGWQVGGANGSIECFHPERGELHVGVSSMVSHPGGANALLAPQYGWPVAPLLSPADAVRHIWPHIRNMLEPGVGYGPVEVVEERPMNWGPPLNVGLVQMRFPRAGVPWHGPVLAVTAPVPYDDRWLFYYSQLGVPDTDDGTVFETLLAAWRAYKPGSGEGGTVSAAQAAADETFKAIVAMNTARRGAFDAANAKWAGAPGPAKPKQ